MYGGRESTNEGQAGIHGWVAELPLFGRSLRVIWVLLLSATVAMEVFPRDPAWGPQLFYSYTAIKAILFFLLGFFTPLAIWAFRSLGLGILIAAFASGAVEGLQYFLAGHHASVLEFGAKVVLLIAAFASGLVIRYDRCLQFGSARLVFLDPHLPEQEQ